MGASSYFLVSAASITKGLLQKKESNSNFKILKDNQIKLVDEESEAFQFNQSNIKDFHFTVNKINQETYEGILFLTDSEGNNHKILGFDDERENYVIDDLKWYINFLKEYIAVK